MPCDTIFEALVTMDGFTFEGAVPVAPAPPPRALRTHVSSRSTPPPEAGVMDFVLGAGLGLFLLLVVFFVVGAVFAAIAAAWNGLRSMIAGAGMAHAGHGARREMDRQSENYLRSVTKLLFGR